MENKIKIWISSEMTLHFVLIYKKLSILPHLIEKRLSLVAVLYFDNIDIAHEN